MSIQQDGKSLILSIFTLVFLIFLVNTLSFAYSWYWKYQELDMFMHAAGGLFISLSALYVYYHSQYATPRHTSFIFSLILALGAVSLSAIFWEFFEFGVGTYLNPEFLALLIRDVNDLLSDLFFGLLGGLIGVISHHFIWRKK